jgi:hypothetical protein
MRAKVYQPCWYPLQGRGSEDGLGLPSAMLSSHVLLVHGGERANTHHRANIALL